MGALQAVLQTPIGDTAPLSLHGMGPGTSLWVLALAFRVRSTHRVPRGLVMQACRLVRRRRHPTNEAAGRPLRRQAARRTTELQSLHNSSSLSVVSWRTCAIPGSLPACRTPWEVAAVCIHVAGAHGHVRRGRVHDGPPAGAEGRRRRRRLPAPRGKVAAVARDHVRAEGTMGSAALVLECRLATSRARFALSSTC